MSNWQNIQGLSVFRVGSIHAYYIVSLIFFNLISVLATHIRPYKGQEDAPSWLTMILLVYNYEKKLKQWWSRNPPI